MKTAGVEMLRLFYADHRQELYTYAVSITRNREAAEDAIQHVFHRLLQRPVTVADLRPYVFRCVRNAALDGSRRERVQADSIFQHYAESDSRVAESEGMFTAEELDAKLKGLSPDEREAIVLKIYNDFTFQEISELRGVPLPTIASWYRRGLGKLKTMLGADFQ